MSSRSNRDAGTGGVRFVDPAWRGISSIYLPDDRGVPPWTGPSEGGEIRARDPVRGIPVNSGLRIHVTLYRLDEASARFECEEAPSCFENGTCHGQRFASARISSTSCGVCRRRQVSLSHGWCVVGSTHSSGATLRRRTRTAAGLSTLSFDVCGDGSSPQGARPGSTRHGGLRRCPTLLASLASSCSSGAASCGARHRRARPSRREAVGPPPGPIYGPVRGHRRR